ncbi:MAG: cobalamin-independent methionine synthase II family protein [Chloroflexi bacterium]|nr:cobalamin-independent methionine synthase II family protein [Chloroflexota bacterium]
MPGSTPLVTTVVGSFPQPDWLVDRDNLRRRLPPRVRASEIWRVPAPYLEQAQDDATLVAIREMERAGVDIVTDGEIRRESYSNRFATALDGIDLDQPGTALDRTGHPNPVPRVVGPIRRRQPVEVRDLQFLRANTTHPVKITVAGPFTMAQQVQDDYYGDPEAMALDYAAAVNEEIRDLFAAGADVVQIDEPYLQARASEARRYAIRVINRALEGVSGTTALHMCFGYAAIVHSRERRYAYLEELADAAVRQISIEVAQPRLDLEPVGALVRAGKTVIVGVLDLGDPAVESEELVASRIRHALRYIPADQLVVAPDCGMKYLPRDVAVGKLRAMSAARNLLAALKK